MTLGGLALAVGILVDDSTVTIENTHRLLEEGTEFDEAVLEGAAGIAVPTLISTLAICSVFVSVFFLQGAARYLFTPLAMAVVFAMLASYGISRTLTPIMIGLLLRKEHERRNIETGWLSRFHAGFNARFDRFCNFYGWLLAGILRRRIVTPAVASLVVIGGSVLFLFVGTDFFPGVDAGLIQLHVRAPARTRIERTEQIFQAIEDNIRKEIPAADLHLILDNIGLPARTYNLAFTDGSTIGVNDGVIQIELAEGHAPTADIIKKLRAELAHAFPDVLFYFQPADLVTQVLNFGVPTQIDVQLQGQDREGNKETAALLQQKLANIPGLVDVHVQQELNAPEMMYTIDRTRAQELGLNMQEVANNLNISLSSSEQVSPNFWTDPQTAFPISWPFKPRNTGSPTKISSTIRCWRAAPMPTARLSRAGSAISRRHSGLPFSRSSTSPTFSRSMTSMAARRIGISAARRRRFKRSSPNLNQDSSPATTLSFEVRSKACKVPSAISA